MASRGRGPSRRSLSCRPRSSSTSDRRRARKAALFFILASVASSLEASSAVTSFANQSPQRSCQVARVGKQQRDDDRPGEAEREA